MPVAVDQARGTVTVTATQLPGNYAVRAGGAIGGLATGFSANLAPAATDFARLPPETLSAVWGVGQRLARTEQELVRDVDLTRVGSELFGWIIVLAALVMAADWIVANRFYAPREDLGPQPGAAAAFAAEAAGVAAGAAPANPPPLPPASAGGVSVEEVGA